MGFFSKKNKKRTLTKRLFRSFMLRQYSKSILLDLQLQAKEDTVYYINQRMRGVPFFEDAGALLDFSLTQVKLDGLYLEFGVANGNSIRRIGNQVQQTIHGFDSFEGLPEAWSNNPIGKFSRKGHLPPVQDHVKLHQGWFDDTAPKFFNESEGDIAFLHIDCDLYSSTKTVFELAKKRIKPGTIIVFDEYFNYPHWQEHEFKAFQEFAEDNGVIYEYIAFSVTRSQVAARIIENPGKPRHQKSIQEESGASDEGSVTENTVPNRIKERIGSSAGSALQFPGQPKSYKRELTGAKDFSFPNR